MSEPKATNITVKEKAIGYENKEVGGVLGS